MARQVCSDDSAAERFNKELNLAAGSSYYYEKENSDQVRKR
jgi:hypothetical protein